MFEFSEQEINSSQRRNSADIGPCHRGWGGTAAGGIVRTLDAEFGVNPGVSAVQVKPDFWGDGFDRLRSGRRGLGHCPLSLIHSGSREPQANNPRASFLPAEHKYLQHRPGSGSRLHRKEIHARCRDAFGLGQYPGGVHRSIRI